ncbi:MAG: cobalamin-independent methionine synthase II family protein [Rhodobacteraceae bacterium]|nr:cobalamin-independent methionine synthase II family protein [Paracoccaceae bacterium]
MAVKSTHVGSLPRSQTVVDMIFARERGEETDISEFDAVMTAACCETVRRQVEAGIDIVSDGETSKISYSTYVKDRYTGFGGDSPRNAPADLKLYPGYLRRLADDGGTPQYSRPRCIGKIESKGQHELLKDIANLKAGMAEHGAREGFMNAASPGVISLFLPNDYFPSREKYLEALSLVMREEYRTIVDAGLYLQLDCPDLALSRHMLFADLSDAEFIRIAEANVAALNAALEGIDPSRVRVHICWGNYEGPHVCDIAMEEVFSTLMRVNADFVLFETSNPRHAYEWVVFRDRFDEIPENKILVPGVIDSTTNFVEHPKTVGQRLERFLEFVPEDRLIAGSDCGFGTFAGFGAVDPEICYAKLAALAEGARSAGQ